MLEVDKCTETQLFRILRLDYSAQRFEAIQVLLGLLVALTEVGLDDCVVKVFWLAFNYDAIVEHRWRV